MTAPRHSARRAGMKQKRVSPLVWQAITSLEQRALSAEAEVKRLRELGDDLAAEAEALYHGEVDRKYDAIGASVRAWRCNDAGCGIADSAANTAVTE